MVTLLTREPMMADGCMGAACAGMPLPLLQLPPPATAKVFSMHQQGLPFLRPTPGDQAERHFHDISWWGVGGQRRCHGNRCGGMLLLVHQLREGYPLAHAFIG